MGEAALFAVGKSVLAKLADLARQEISLAWFAKDELKKLEQSLGSINATLQAFEEGQYVKTSPTNDWLEKLKDVAYDADDVLDEFAVEVSRQRMEQICFCTLDEVWEFSSRLLYYFKLGHQIKEIRGRLANITADWKNFHPIAQPNLLTSPVDVETHSLLSDDIIGRDEDKNAIMKLLTDSEPDNARNVPVIPIVGLGGVGKTTLAKFVFNDEMVVKNFDPRIWVCVSHDFDAKTIAKKIIECITNTKCDELEMEGLQRSLRPKLDGKTYFLVLDDVWNEDYEKWVPLKDLLKCGDKKSKILVTTRSLNVASLMGGTTAPHLLSPLSNNECWSLFKQRAFERTEEDYKTLVPIGKEILNKCGGVPLAVTALGSLLRCRSDEIYWRYVRDSDIWQLTGDVPRIMAILKFSYDHLPSHLKACFAYCSLFPKDCDIYREKLIYLWMANGLIQSSNREMEDVGNEYFHILLSRSFFQDAEKDDDDGNIKRCKMHDLMHDLARSIAGTECLIVGKDAEGPQGGDITPPQGSARHLWLSGELNPQLLNTANKLRTLLKPDGQLELPLHYNKCLSFKRLRALDLSSSNHERLPDSICELKHLRYLDLSESDIGALPDSFSRLQNLQTLIVRNCLHLDRLPDSICELKHLRYLDLSHSDIKALSDSFSRLQNLQTLNVSLCELLEELPKDMWKMAKLRHIINKGTTFMTHMPSGLGQLSSLQTLSKFAVGDNIGGRISELGPLDGLRGKLCIYNLDHVTDLADATKASLEKKQNLNFLKLMWFPKQIWNGRQEHHEDILGRLHPPKNLKKLKIYGYAGVKFPNLRMSTLERLVSITLREFSGCQHLSALGDLPSLQFLRLEYMPNLECIDGGFTSLEILYLDNLPKLEKWGGQLSYLPRLTTLAIESCPSLVEMPFFPSLETWKLRCGRGELLSRSMTSTNTSSTLSGIRTLKSLCIYDCDDLKCLPAEGLKNLVSLEDLILRCSSLKSLSEDVLQHLSALRSLSIQYCPMITSLPISPYVTRLSIQNCPNATWLEAEPEDSLTGFRSLQELRMEFLPKVVSLPKALQHATSLQSLRIYHCDGLTTIPEWLPNLASLQELVLESCPLLTCLPEGMQRLTRLQNLRIRACPHLYWRCKEETGEDWAKIAHIQNKIIIE